jgi:hypothetical protein
MTKRGAVPGHVSRSSCAGHGTMRPSASDSKRNSEYDDTGCAALLRHELIETLSPLTS